LKHPDVRLKNCPEHLHLFLYKFEYFILSSAIPSVIFYLPGMDSLLGLVARTYTICSAPDFSSLVLSVFITRRRF
jgi:hypothetical protein